MVMSQRHPTKTLTGLQNKTKHPTTENKRITEIGVSHEIILLWAFMNMVCDESGLFRMVCFGVQTTETNSFETIHLSPYSVETTVIYDHIHL